MMSFSRLARMAGGFIGALAVSHAAHAAPAPESFGQLRNVHDAAISPDGHQLALMQNLKGQYIINVIDLRQPKAEPRLVALGKGVKPKYVKWVNDGRVLASFRQTETMRGQIFDSSFFFTIDTNTMDGKVLVRPKNGFRQFNDQVLDWLEDDPDHILMQFAGDGENQNYPDVRKVDVRTGYSQIVKRQARRMNDWISDTDGVPRVGLGWRSEGQDAYMVINEPGTDNWMPYTDYPGLDPESQRIVAVTDGGRSLVVAAYRGKDTRGLHRYDLVTRQFAETLYENDEYDVSGVIMSADGDTIVGARFVGESEERILFDRYRSTYEEALARFVGFQVDFVDQSADRDTLLVRVSAPYDPGGLYVFRRGGQMQKIAPNLNGLSSQDMGEVLSIRYAARDGQKIPAFVTLPRKVAAGTAPKNVPFIVLPHGGPYARDEKRFDWLAQFFASQGYGVMQMNFRGSEGYGKTFAESGRNNWVVMQEDVEDGMRYLLRKGYADPERSCIAGWSYGGYAALMGAAKTPDLYNCAIAIAALTDIPDAMRDSSDFLHGKARAQRTFGSIMADKDLLRANNPVDVADRITVPVFMAHGDQDTAVEFDQFTRMRKRLDKAGVKGTYMAFEDEDHYMSAQSNRQAMLKGIAKFLRKTNGTSAFAPD